jgi:hypothetical protein
MGRFAWQCSAGLRSQESLIRRSIGVDDGVDAKPMSPVGTFDASVDKAGVKIGTILGAPSDRVLTREIKAAEIVPFL